MNDPFIPLVTEPVTGAAPAADPFHHVATPAAAPAPHGPPEITLKRDGDKVTHIVVRCACGEVIELGCVY